MKLWYKLGIGAGVLAIAGGGAYAYRRMHPTIPANTGNPTDNLPTKEVPNKPAEKPLATLMSTGNVFAFNQALNGVDAADHGYANPEVSPEQPDTVYHGEVGARGVDDSDMGAGTPAPRGPSLVSLASGAYRRATGGGSMGPDAPTRYPHTRADGTVVYLTEDEFHSLTGT